MIRGKEYVKEKISSEKVFITGNTVIDILLDVSIRKLPEPIGFDGNKLNLDASIKKVLITGHRRENFGQGFINICSAIKSLALNNPEIEFIYPVHLNPNVKNIVFEILKNINNIILLPPQAYLEFVNLMKNSYIILTDSGGIQEEAPSLGIPVLVMRNTTERQEAVNVGTVKLVGTDESSIKLAVQSLLDNKQLYRKMANANNPYGDGNASLKIKNILVEKYKI